MTLFINNHVIEQSPVVKIPAIFTIYQFSFSQGPLPQGPLPQDPVTPSNFFSCRDGEPLGCAHQSMSKKIVQSLIELLFPG